MKVPRPGADSLWAFLSTASGAGGTLLCLLFARGTAWAPEFVQLYSILGMVAGWLNAMLFYYGPRSHFLLTRLGGVTLFLFSLILAASLYRLIFGGQISIWEISLLAGSLSPVLYSGIYGLEFHEGNYPWVFKRAVAFNGLLALAPVITFAIGGSQHTLYLSFGAIGILILFFRLIESSSETPKLGGGKRSVKPWLNPTMPVLERAVWDQWTLAQLQNQQLSLAVYFVGRCITFFGNFFYTFLLGKIGKAKTVRRQQLDLRWALWLAGICLALSTIVSPYGAILFGQFLAWATAAQLTKLYGPRTSTRRYGLILAAWIADICLRTVVLYYAKDFSGYATGLVIASIPLFLILWRPMAWRRKPNPLGANEDAAILD